VTTARIARITARRPNTIFSIRCKVTSPRDEQSSRCGLHRDSLDFSELSLFLVWLAQAFFYRRPFRPPSLYPPGAGGHKVILRFGTHHCKMPLTGGARTGMPPRLSRGLKSMQSGCKRAFFRPVDGTSASATGRACTGGIGAAPLSCRPRCVISPRRNGASRGCRVVFRQAGQRKVTSANATLPPCGFA